MVFPDSLYLRGNGWSPSSDKRCCPLRSSRSDATSHRSRDAIQGRHSVLQVPLPGRIKNLFGKDIEYKKIKFSKKNVNSQNLNFYLKKGNLWHDYYIFLYSLKKNFPTEYLNIFPFKSKVKKFFYKKIKYKKTTNSIKHNNNSYKKIYNYYKLNNQKFYNKMKINYL